MPTPYESARLNLQLFEMRREPVLREARAWFLAELRAAAGEPDFCRHVEEVVLAAPDAAATMARRRAAALAAAKARAAAPPPAVD